LKTGVGGGLSHKLGGFFGGGDPDRTGDPRLMSSTDT
jgi:hypothetical protein